LVNIEDIIDLQYRVWRAQCDADGRKNGASAGVGMIVNE
jgi:hypothetical protein